MATKDLGTISVPVNTNTPAQRSPDVLGNLIGPAGRVAGSIRQSIDNAHVAEGRQAMEDIVDSELGREEAPLSADEAQPVLMGPPTRAQDPRTGDSQADSLVQEIMRLENVVVQAPSNRKGRAALEMRGKLQDLREQRPKLAAALEGELSSIERFDPEFAVLGLLDASAIAGQERAQEDLDRFKEFAYDKTIADGGWGLDPVQHPFGSNTFALAAANSGRIQTARRQNDMSLKALDAQENLDVKDSAAAYQDFLMGSSSFVKVAITQYDGMIQQLGRAYLDLNNPNSVRVIEQFDVPGGQKDAMIKDIDLWSMQIEDSLQKAFPANLQDTGEFTAMRQATDQQLQALASLKEGLRTNNAGMVNAWGVYEAAANFKFEHDFPVVATMIRNLNRAAPIMEHMKEDLTGAGDAFNDAVAQGMNNAIPAILGRAIGLDSAVGLTSDMTPEQVRTHLRGVRDQNADMYDTHIPGPRNNQVAALQEMRNLNIPVQIDRAKPAADGTRTSDPEMSRMITNSMASALDDATMKRDLAPVDQRQALFEAAPPGFRHVVNQTRDVARGQADNWVNNYESLFRDYKPNRDDQFRADAATLVSPDSDVTIGEVMQLDVDKLKESGEVVFVVNEQFVLQSLRTQLDQVAKAERNSYGPSASRFQTPFDIEEELQGALLRASNSAGEMSARVTKELQTHAEFRAAKRGANDLDYEEAWAQGGFNKIFTELD